MLSNDTYSPSSVDGFYLDDDFDDEESDTEETIMQDNQETYSRVG